LKAHHVQQVRCDQTQQPAGTRQDWDALRIQGLWRRY
jgi:hypothetical protein